MPTGHTSDGKRCDVSKRNKDHENEKRDLRVSCDGERRALQVWVHLHFFFNHSKRMKLWPVHASTVDGGFESFFWGAMSLCDIRCKWFAPEHIISEHPIRMPLRALRKYRQSNGRCKVCWTWRNRVNFNCWRRQLAQIKSCHSFRVSYFFCPQARKGL